MKEYIKKLRIIEDIRGLGHAPGPFELMYAVNEIIDYLNMVISVGILPYPEGYDYKKEEDVTP